jgi:carbon monoxide dehydrogenase subunit G
MRPVIESVVVRRPVAEVARFATDPEVVLPLMGGFGRFAHIRDYPDGSQEWDLFLDVGSIHVGGRVLVGATDDHTLEWQALRGTRHHARLEVTEEEGVGARITTTMTAEFAGLLAAAVTNQLARGILRRHLQAGLQHLRHQLEYGERA